MKKTITITMLALLLLSSAGILSSVEHTPSGVCVVWSGAISAIPSGWVLCDGNNGTPNLTDRFILHADADAAGTNNVGDTGGASTHTHADTFSIGGSTGDKEVDNNHDDSVTDVASDSHTHSLSGSVSAGNNVPKYYALAWIMKL